MHFRPVDPDLLEDPAAAHHAHDAAPTIGAGGRRHLEPARLALGMDILQPLETRDDPGTQQAEPGSGLCLAAVGGIGHGHVLGCWSLMPSTAARCFPPLEEGPMKRLTFLALAALAACGTPQEQCINRNTRDLRTVDRLIAESEGNLQRGYAYETITVYEPEWSYCRAAPVRRGPARTAAPAVPGRTPRVQDAAQGDRPERRGTEAGQPEGKAEGLARQAEAVIAQCKAAYPE
jgi:hypothetical protein